MTTTLMTYAGTAEPAAPVTRTGGVPLAPAGTAWPHCATCAGPMQFLAQILLDDLGRQAGQGASAGRSVLALFACQNDPGQCEDWAPQAGGNRALLFPAEGLRPIPVPDEEDVLLGEVSAVGYRTFPAADYDQARAEWTGDGGRGPREILGSLGGQPDWLQFDETPACPGCARPMPLVAQLEEGHDHTTAMNFGGGTGYAFACEPCVRAVFLWQC